MSGGSEAKSHILAAIRDALAEARMETELHGAATPEPIDAPAPARPPEPTDAGAPLRGFVDALEAVGGRVTVVRDLAEAAEAVARLARDLGARTAACSDDPRAIELAQGLGLPVVPPGGPRKDLLEADLGITGAQWGIAETGTLVLESDAERHRLASLVPPVHVAILDASRILVGLGDALDAVRKDGPGSQSRAITFITGPSRTADIELTLVVGVHGPKELHVLLLAPPTS